MLNKSLVGLGCLTFGFALVGAFVAAVLLDPSLYIPVTLDLVSGEFCFLVARSCN